MEHSRRYTALLALILAAFACTLPGTADTSPGLSETQVALAIQQTSLANQQATLLAPSVPPPASTYTPYPTYTPLPAPTEAQGGSTAPVAPTTVDMHDLIKKSNILIYEDILGDPTLLPMVDRTISAMSFSGGKIVNAGDALGTFKQHANSSTKWDLMIVASEVRSGFSGEMFEMMYDHIDNGGAVIIEAWHLDKISNGKIAPILSRCGVRFQRNWIRNFDYDPFDYSIYWLDQSHPLLSTPNAVQAPSYPYPVWFTDAGDLIELGAGGDAVMVGGLHASRKSDYGVLAVCMGGRMVIQTFSSHDYEWEVVQPLWVNYITYTLTNHYEGDQ